MAGPVVTSPRIGVMHRALASIAPRTAARRLAARMSHENLMRSYEAAARDRSTDGWNAGGGSADAHVSASAALMRERMRDLVRNNPLAANAVEVLVDSMVGAGVMPRAKTGNKDQDRRIDELFSEWSKNACADGHTDFGGVLRLAVREMLEGGDVFAVRRRRRRNSGLKVPMQIELKEADHLDGTRFGNLAGGGRISQGIEYDPQGRRTAYHLFPDHPGSLEGYTSIEPQRVPADQVAHLFERQRVQSRGVPWGVPALRRLRDVDDWQVAELVRKKTEACMVAMVIGDDAEQTSLTPGVVDADGVMIDQFSPGLIGYVQGGKDVKFNTPGSTAGVAEWHRVQLHIIAAGFRVPYALLTGDLSQVNFSSSRVGLNEFRRMVSAFQWTVLIPMLCERIWGWFVEAAYLAGHIGTDKVPVEWAPERFESVNPLQDVQADQAEVRAGFATQTQMIAKRGEDPAKVRKEWQEDAAANDAAGLVFDSDPRRVSKGGGAQPSDPADADLANS